MKIERMISDTVDKEKESKTNEIREKQFDELIASGLKKIGDLDDSQMVVISDYVGSKEIKIKDLKNLITTMKDSGNILSLGEPYSFILVDTNVDNFRTEETKEIESKKEFYLFQLSQYADDQLLTYVHPNHVINPLTGIQEIYQKKAGELRELVNNMDGFLIDKLSHAGGIEIISSDPEAYSEIINRRKKQKFHKLKNSDWKSGMKSNLNSQFRGRSHSEFSESED